MSITLIDVIIYEFVLFKELSFQEFDDILEQNIPIQNFLFLQKAVEQFFSSVPHVFHQLFVIDFGFTSKFLIFHVSMKDFKNLRIEFKVFLFLHLTIKILDQFKNGLIIIKLQRFALILRDLRYSESLKNILNKSTRILLIE